MRIALDTNVILYAEGLNDSGRRDLAHRLIAAIGPSNLVIPIQALGETLSRLTKGAHMTKADAALRVAPWFHSLRTQDTNRSVFDGASELVSKHMFQTWDAVILAAAWAGGASLLLSEDMQDGFRWRETVIANPFTPDPHPIIQMLLGNHS
jgi:predicted nucleic acid-binding protein